MQLNLCLITEAIFGNNNRNNKSNHGKIAEEVYKRAQKEIAETIRYHIKLLGLRKKRKIVRLRHMFQPRYIQY